MTVTDILDGDVPLLLFGDKTNKHQSQLTKVEQFIYGTENVAAIYKSETEEATALQAMHLSGSTATATYPFLVRPTHNSYISEPDIFVDLLRMQAALPLTDADRALSVCAKCNRNVDRRGHHAAFCPMTRTHSHDAFVRELRDFLRATGTSVMLESVHIIPHLPDKASAKTQGERLIPDLEVTRLDDSGRRYLVDVTVTTATYQVDAGQKAGAAAAKAEGRKTREYKSKVDGKTTLILPAAIEMSGRSGEGLVSPFQKREFPWLRRKGRTQLASLLQYGRAG